PPVRIADRERNIEISYFEDKPHLLVPGQELSGLKEGNIDRQEIYPLEDILKDFPKKNPRFNQWKYVDWEGDGDKDLLIGVDDWGDYGWDNAYDEQGNWTNGPLHGYVYLIRNDDGEYVNTGRLEAGGEVLDG